MKRSESTSRARRFALRVGLLGVLTSFVGAQELQGVTWNGFVVRVDVVSGAVTVVGNCGFDRINSQAMTDSGRIFTYTNQFDAGQLLELDPETGLGTAIGSPNPDVDDVRGMAWDEASGLLYLLNNTDLFDPLHTGELYTTDPDTGVSTFVTELVLTPGSPYGSFSCLEITPDGTLYGWNLGASPDSLNVIDKQTGVATELFTTEGDFPGTFHPLWMTSDASGTLWCGSDGDLGLHTVDLVAQTTTPVVTFAFKDIRGMDFLPSACPGEPATTTVRPGVPANPSVLTAASDAFVGTTWSASIDHAGGFAPGAVLDLFALGSATNVPTPFGTLLVTPILFVQAPPTDGVDLPIPLDCSLVGGAVSVQGASADASGAFQVTNALDLVLGS
ncbi:MAG: hypothetical protein AAF682_31820 [Planctomycetota bacterium]